MQLQTKCITASTCYNIKMYGILNIKMYFNTFKLRLALSINEKAAKYKFIMQINLKYRLKHHTSAYY